MGELGGGVTPLVSYLGRKSWGWGSKLGRKSWKIFEEFKGVGLIFENMEKSDSVREREKRQKGRRKCRIWNKEDLGKIRF